MTVGNVDEKASVIIAPEAGQVKISIWPGVSTRTWSSWSALFFITDMTCILTMFKIILRKNWEGTQWRKKLHGLKFMYMVENEPLA